MWNPERNSYLTKETVIDMSDVLSMENLFYILEGGSSVSTL